MKYLLDTNVISEQRSKQPEVITWGELTGRLARAGRPLPALDSLIAALALHHGCTLATRNTDDFMGTGVPVYNPWQPEP